MDQNNNPNKQQGGREMLTSNFSLAKFVFLGIITLGIYPIVIMSKISVYINIIAGPYDEKKTMHYCLVFFVFSWLTCGIVPLVWYHRLSNRIGDELNRRGIKFDFSAKTYWLWGILGALIVAGPFIYTYKLLDAMNLLADSYNSQGK